MPGIHLFQIRYDASQDLDDGFEVLENTENLRPDWFEYWPMREFLLKQPLDEGEFYGFFSPRFTAKTNLTAAMVRRFVVACDAATDVILFSPSIHNSAFFLNVFEHGESEHPGLMGTASRVFERLGRTADLSTLVSDSRNTVYSNYFVAKPRFWRAWLAVTEALFALAEDGGDSLAAELRAPTTYRGGRAVQMKVFVLERIATWLLMSDRRFTCRARDPFAARARFYKLPVAIVCDALKIAFVTQGRAQYRDVFFMVRGLRKLLNLQIRFADGVGLRRVRPFVRDLRSYWQG